MGLRDDLRVIYHLATGTRGGAGDHAGRMEGFFGPQAADYDAFRARCLHGREPLLRALPLPEGGTLVDLGGGTGSNLDLLGERLGRPGRMAARIAQGRALSIELKSDAHNGRAHRSTATGGLLMAVSFTKAGPPATPPATLPVTASSGAATPTAAGDDRAPDCVPFTPAGTVRVRYTRGEELQPLPYPAEDE